MTGEKWQQKQSNKEYDIVVLVSQRKGVNKKPILKVLQKLQSFFKTSSIDSRYALIGFGGKGAYEEAHVRALGKGATVFGTMNDLKRTISNTLIFNGDEDISNDAYHAIVEASLQRFRPGAHKIFVMFNSEPHTSHKYGASFREAIFTLQKESHASLFVFDEINFKSLNKKGMTIGQTNDKIYTTRNLKGLKLSGMELPASEFRDMVQRTNGGMFTNNLINKQNELATVLFDAISDTVTENQRKCLDCEIQTTWFGNSRQLCHPVAC